MDIFLFIATSGAGATSGMGCPGDPPQGLGRRWPVLCCHLVAGALHAHLWDQPKEWLLLWANEQCFRIKETNYKFSWPCPLLTRRWKLHNATRIPFRSRKPRRWPYPLRSVFSYWWSLSVCWAANPSIPRCSRIYIGNHESLCVASRAPKPYFPSVIYSMQNCKGFSFSITLPRLFFVVIIRLGVFPLVVFLCGFAYLVSWLVVWFIYTNAAPWPLWDLCELLSAPWWWHFK